MKQAEIKTALENLPTVLVEFKERMNKEYNQFLKELNNRLHQEYENSTDKRNFTKTVAMDHGSTIAQIFLGNLRIEDLVKKAVEDKIAKLYYTICDKAGKILDCSNLYIGVNGDINGTIKGEIKEVKVTSIIAGGWNIQCKHFRVLVK